MQELFDSFFLFRCSSNNTVNDSTLLLCNNVTKVIGEVCHRTNQVYLMDEWIEGMDR